jgi:hypothetical protein
MREIISAAINRPDFHNALLAVQQAKTAMSSVTTAWAGGSKGTKAKSLAVSVSYAPELKTVSALEANPCLIAKWT